LGQLGRYSLSMELQELQREVERLNPEEQRKLISFLVALDLRRDEGFRDELQRRLDDRDPNGWIRLDEAERRLRSDGV
jgi:hypothetical protein